METCRLYHNKNIAHSRRFVPLFFNLLLNEAIFVMKEELQWMQQWCFKTDEFKDLRYLRHFERLVNSAQAKTLCDKIKLFLKFTQK